MARCMALALERLSMSDRTSAIQQYIHFLNLVKQQARAVELSVNSTFKGSLNFDLLQKLAFW